MRTDFRREDLSAREFYALLNSVVVPRPIAWVSSISEAGVDNLAPHSFYTVASVNPPIIQFTSVGEKDSLRNIEATKDFVVNLTPENLFEQVNATGTNFPADISEFDAVGLTREPALTVAAPRVKESPVALECRLYMTLPIGDCTVVFGEVLHAAIAAEVLDGPHPRVDLLKPLSRLGKDQWGTAGHIREIKRIRAADWPGHYKR